MLLECFQGLAQEGYRTMDLVNKVDSLLVQCHFSYFLPSHFTKHQNVNISFCQLGQGGRGERMLGEEDGMTSIQEATIFVHIVLSDKAITRSR